MGRVVQALAAPFRLLNSVRDEIAKDRRLRLDDGAGWSRFSGRESVAGKVVTADTALQMSAVWACVRVSVLAFTSMPLALYRRKSDSDRERLDSGDVLDVLTDSPNQDQTPLEFWEECASWLLTRGNAYAEIVRIGPRLSALQPLPASQVQPQRDSDGVLRYRIRDRGRSETLPRDKVFHLKGFGQGLHNRDMGLSPIAAGVNSLGAAMASSEAAAATFANGMRPSGFFLFDQQLDPEQRKQAREALVEPFQGARRAGGVGVLEAGVKWQGVSINPEDAQMLETRRFDIEEICRWWGVPPIVIGHSAEGQTMWGSGVEQILLSWLVLGIGPLCNRIEARIAKQLLRQDGRQVYAEFNREALLQMDSKAKAAFLSTMVQNGLMTRGEGRAKLNLPARPGTDTLTAQTNLAPLEKLGADAGAGQVRAALRQFLGMDEGDRDDEA